MTNWQAELPRPQFKQFRQLAINSNWFTAYDVGHDIIAICEPYQFQEVMSFLVKGSQAALLIDTGLGVSNIADVVSQLWDKKLMVVNTHKHFDHIGSDACFDQVFVFKHPSMIKIMEQGYSLEHYRQVLADDTFSTDSPIKHFVYHWTKPNIRPFNPGYTFDLGNRQLTAEYAPGHSDDSIVLSDRQNHLLFTGDTWYPAVLYSFEGVPLTVYQKTLADLGRRYGDYTLVCSHNEPYAPASVLTETANMINSIINQSLPGKPNEDGIIYTQNNLRLWVK